MSRARTLALSGILLLGLGLIVTGATGTATSTNREASSTQTHNANITYSPLVDTELYSSNLPFNNSNKLAPPEGRKVVKGVNVDPRRVVFIGSEINFMSMQKATAQLQELDNSTGDIYILISSPGGSVLDGSTFISAMESSRNKVYTVCVDLCASMAAIIHQHGAKRFAYDRAILMFHDASGGARGKVGEMMSMLQYIQRSLEKTNRYIAHRSGMNYNDFASMVVKDLWIDSEDAKNLGLVDDIIKVIPNVQVNDLLSVQAERLKRQQDGPAIDGSQGNVITISPMTIGVTR